MDAQKCPLTAGRTAHRRSRDLSASFRNHPAETLGASSATSASRAEHHGDDSVTAQLLVRVQATGHLMNERRRRLTAGFTGTNRRSTMTPVLVTKLAFHDTGPAMCRSEPRARCSPARQPPARPRRRSGGWTGHQRAVLPTVRGHRLLAADSPLAAVPLGGWGRFLPGHVPGKTPDKPSEENFGQPFCRQALPPLLGPRTSITGPSPFPALSKTRREPKPTGLEVYKGRYRIPARDVLGRSSNKSYLIAAKPVQYPGRCHRRARQRAGWGLPPTRLAGWAGWPGNRAGLMLATKWPSTRPPQPSPSGLTRAFQAPTPDLSHCCRRLHQPS